MRIKKFLLRLMLLFMTLSVAHAGGDKRSIHASSPQISPVCQEPIQGPMDIEADPFYSDVYASQPDPLLAQKNALTTQVFKGYLEHVISDADQYVLKSNKGAGLCAVRWMEAWANDGAMLGNMIGQRGGVEAANNRRAFATGFGVAYLKVRDLANLQQRKIIGAWLLQLERRNRQFMQVKKQRNNLLYWGGLESLTAGIAAHDQDAIDFARSVHHQAVDDILDNGSQPIEMKRGQMSFIYSNVALEFILMMAHLSRCAGEDWSLYRPDRLALLVNRIYEGIFDPRWYIDQTNTIQKNPKPYNLGWVAIYSGANLIKIDRLGQKIDLSGEYRVGGNWEALQKVCH